MLATENLTRRFGHGRDGHRFANSRFAYSEEAVCRLTETQGNAAWVAQVRDISAEEVGLVLPAFIPPGTVLTAEVRGPSWRSVPSFQLQVRRSWHEEGAGWRLEGTFLQPLTEDQLFRMLL